MAKCRTCIFEGAALPFCMNKLRDFFRKYRQYILTDGLMYLIFIVFIALLFIFFR